MNEIKHVNHNTKYLDYLFSYFEKQIFVNKRILKYELKTQEIFCRNTRQPTYVQ